MHVPASRTRFASAARRPIGGGRAYPRVPVIVKRPRMRTRTRPGTAARAAVSPLFHPCFSAVRRLFAAYSLLRKSLWR